MKKVLSTFTIGIFLSLGVFTTLTFANWPTMPVNNITNGWINDFFNLETSDTNRLVLNNKKISAKDPQEDQDLVTKKYLLDNFDTSGRSFTYSVGGKPNYCFEIDSEGNGTAINNGKICDNTNINPKKCWNGVCLENNNGGDRFCRSLDYDTNFWSIHENILQRCKFELGYPEVGRCDSYGFCNRNYRIVFLSISGSTNPFEDGDSICQAEANLLKLQGNYGAWYGYSSELINKFNLYDSRPALFIDIRKLLVPDFNPYLDLGFKSVNLLWYSEATTTIQILNETTSVFDYPVDYSVFDSKEYSQYGDGIVTRTSGVFHWVGSTASNLQPVHVLCVEK